MEQSGITDEELARRFRQGDQASGMQLFDRHFALLRPLVRRRLGAHARTKLAESDVIQSALVVVAQRLAEFEDRGPGSFERWLRGILAHKVREGVRHFYKTGKRDAHREVGLDSATADHLHAQTESPSAAASRDEERRALLASIATLPQDYRWILRLVHVDGMTLVDASKSMGRSADAARKLYARAVAMLAALRRPEEEKR